MTLVRRLLAIPVAIGLTIAGAAAQTYPDRLVRIMVPQGPGGPTDLLARVAAQRLQAVLHQNFIIENRGGAGGVIAAKAAGSAEPDGHTLFMGNTSVLVLIPILSKSANYDPQKLFAPVARIAESYQVLVVNPSLPVKTVAELVAYAKANPNRLNYASAGIGNTIHLAGELFNHVAGTRIVHVPYTSGAEATTAVLGGQVQMTFVNVTGLPPLIADGKLRALAVTSPKRLSLLPDVPTMIESGYPDFVVRAFFGLAAPAGTPAPIVDKLNAAINAEMTSNEMQTTLKRLGAEAGSGNAAEFAAFIAQERRRWSAVAKAANISID
ncbi:MAG: tripartite tricarboxylate transporter substrate binding protein [Xanthobacteraceae bacterium]|nr:tripartite tricarboxylate transporter substrate binding protein [Xanthobacteraceae bacterium]